MKYVHKRKGKKFLTEFHRKHIILLAQTGITIPAIAEKLDLSVNVVRKYFTKWDLTKSNVSPAYLGSKRQAYYKDENEYGSYPVYRWEDLSQSEIDVYLKEN
tara:strand:- start:220 stop:525 length:306 start_codon:yes stop_codon:yes gene_type:complete